MQARTSPRSHSATFDIYSLRNGVLCDHTESQFPSIVRSWTDGRLDLSTEGTHFGYVQSGVAELSCESGEFRLGAGMYFSAPMSARISGNSSGFVVSRLGFVGLFQIGGKIESKGRLNYIDGSTDTLLIAPVLKGDPCLNLLYFPPGIDQTPHTHPSLRAGIIAAGQGFCRTEREVIPMRAGSVFIIHPEQIHSFITEDSEMKIIAYHPDSDFGATHEDHPMINRTIVNGLRASEIKAIRTGVNA